MKYSTAIIPVFAVASLAASIETRQSKKLPWKEETNGIDCGPRGISEYICGTKLFCDKINDPGLEACENPQGWKSPQQCLDAHEAKPSREKCTKLRRDAFDQCREKSEFQECVTKGQDVFEECMGIQKFQSPKEQIAELRAKGCQV
ncbi:hypothetical protein MAJ_08435, partial [Metarhizium majus ARSEF 297]